MYKKLLLLFLSIFFITGNTFADSYNPDAVIPFFPILYFGNKAGLLGETAVILPGNNPQSNPHIPGAVVQFFLDGGDEVISPPDSNGNPTGDDQLKFTIAIGNEVPIIVGEVGLFNASCNYGGTGDKIYARVFNKSTLTSSTHYGQTSLVTVGSLPGVGDDKWFDIDDYGLVQTKIPLNPADDWVSTAEAGTGYSATEGSTIMLNANGTTDPDTDLSNLTFAWDLDDDGDYDDATGITTNYTCLDNDTFNIGLKVSNPISGTASIDSAVVTVSNANPQITDIADQTANIDEFFTISTTYYDPGINDTHTVNIDWGDGNVENDITVSGGVINLSHTYESTALFSAELTIFDDNGGSDSTSFTVAVTAPPVNVFVDITITDDVNLIWASEASYTYQIWFLDGDVKPFNPSNGTWHLIDIVAAGEYHDTGDEDGYDNIPDSADDRDHPLNVESRHYCIFEIIN